MIAARMTAIGLSRRAPSLLGRFRTVLNLLFGLGALVALMAAWYFAGTAADEAYDRLLVSAAVQIADTIDISQGELEVLPPDSAFETLALAEEDRFFYAVRGPDGTLMTGYPTLPAATDITRPDLAIQTIPFSRDRVRLVTLTRIVQSGGHAGTFKVTVGETRRSRELMQRQLFMKFGVVTLGLVFLGFVSAMVAARVAIHPLAALEANLASRNPQDLTPLTVDGPKEAHALVAEINRLMMRLGDRLETLRQFSAVAAHQLRTHLTAASAQIELLSYERPEGASDARIEKLRFRLQELNRLVHQLLGHAMIAYRGEAQSRDTVDLVRVVETIMLHEIPQALDRDLTIELVTKETSIKVVGDAVMLQEAVTNLINNAVSHGAPGLLRVELTSENGEAQVAVIDDGPGIPAQFWGKVSTPFSAARGDGTGAGLGLSIAKQTAETHGGSLHFHHTAEGYFRVVLTIPLGMP